MQEKTLQEITQDIIAQVSGASKSDESKFYEESVDNLVDEGRSDIINNLGISSNNIISETWQTRFLPVYSLEKQEGECCTVKFEIPSPIRFTNGEEAITYVGARNGHNGYDRVGLLGAISTDMLHPITNPLKNGRVSWALGLDETGFTYIEIYGNTTIENILVKSILSKPSQNPYFRRDTDLYPISGELITKLKGGVVNKIMMQMAQTPQDTVDNGEDPLNAAFKALNAIKRGG